MCAAIPDDLVTPLTVSALVRVYNGEHYIEETLTSILEQTRPADEVLVVDDGSTDSTAELVRSFGDAVRLVRQTNQGHSVAFSRGFQEARCDFVANCDADDLWEPTKLERQLKALTEHPEVDIAFTGTVNFGLDDLHWVEAPRTGLLPAESLLPTIYRQNLICMSSTVIRRSLVNRIGAFDSRFATCEDYDFCLRALGAGSPFYFDPEVLVRHRTHAQATTQNRIGSSGSRSSSTKSTPA